MKLVAIATGLLAVGGSAVVWKSVTRQEAAAAGISEDLLHSVERGELNITITENGTLVAKDSRGVSPDMRGSNKIEWLIEEGKTVEEGEMVCRLDSTELVKDLEQLDLELVKAKADLASARTELEIQQSDNVANEEKAVIALEKAESELERYRDGDSKKERRALNIAIKDAETSYAQRKKNFENSKTLVDQGFMNVTELEVDEIEFEKAEVQLEGATLDLELFEKYTLPMTMRDKETAVKDAKRELETARKRGASTLRQKEVAVEQAEKRLKKLEERYEEKKENKEKCELKAPCPGIVIYGDPKEPWYTDDVKVGGEIWGTRTIITIPDLRVMQVKVKIHEADINKVEKGQTAVVSMDTYPGLILKGEVTKVAGIAGGSDRWGNDDDVKRFDVEITLETAPEGVSLKPGISAKAEIFIEKKSDVVYVPLQSMFLEEGAHYVYVWEQNQPVAKQVTPGMNNDNYIEILEGIEEGHRVMLVNPNIPTASSAGGDDEEPANAPQPVPAAE